MEPDLKCYYHPDRDASAQCDRCQDFLCEECMRVSMGRHLCVKCWHQVDPQGRDKEHLRVLSVLHYVLAGLVALGGGGLCGIYIAIGIGIMTNPQFAAGPAPVVQFPVVTTPPMTAAEDDLPDWAAIEEDPAAEDEEGLNIPPTTVLPPEIVEKALEDGGKISAEEFKAIMALEKAAEDGEITPEELDALMEQLEDADDPFAGNAAGPGVVFQGPNQAPMFRAIGTMFVVLFSIIFLLCLLMAACLVVSGLSLSRRKRYIFCFVIAAICCAQFPFGTALGIFTIIVLSRQTVKELFGRTPSMARAQD